MMRTDQQSAPLIQRSSKQTTTLHWPLTSQEKWAEWRVMKSCSCRSRSHRSRSTSQDRSPVTEEAWRSFQSHEASIIWGTASSNLFTVSFLIHFWIPWVRTGSEILFRSTKIKRAGAFFLLWYDLKIFPHSRTQSVPTNAASLLARVLQSARSHKQGENERHLQQ